MGKAILAAIFTLIAGYLGTVIGLELLGGWTEFGVLVAVCVMGAFIITSTTRRSKRHKEVLMRHQKSYMRLSDARFLRYASEWRLT